MLTLVTTIEPFVPSDNFPRAVGIATVVIIIALVLSLMALLTGLESAADLTKDADFDVAQFQHRARVAVRVAAGLIPAAATAVGVILFVPYAAALNAEDSDARAAWAAEAASWAEDVYGVDGGLEQMLLDDRNGLYDGTVTVDGLPQNVTVTFVDGQSFLMAADTNAELPRVGN